MSSGDFTWQGLKRQLDELRARVDALEAKSAPITDMDSYHAQPVSLDELIVDGPIGDYNVSRANWFGGRKRVKTWNRLFDNMTAGRLLRPLQFDLGSPGKKLAR